MTRRSDDDFRREIDAHIALETDRLIAEGLSPEKARAAAVRRFGNVTRVRERFYESQRLLWLDHLRQDVRYALRSFARTPLFAVTAVVSLAIGIGADATVFTVANALLFRAPAAVADPDALIAVSATRGEGFGINEISFPNYRDLRERATTVVDLYGSGPFAEPMSLVDSSGLMAERIFGHNVTPNYFAVLGVRPTIGRLFGGASSYEPDSNAIVLSHAFWTKRFNEDPAVVGQTVQINGEPMFVIGVAAERFQGTSLVATDVWVPMDITPASTSFMNRRDLGWALVGGRRRPGISLAQAAAEIETIGRSLEREYPDLNRGSGLRVAAASAVPGNLAVPLTGILALLLGFVSLVLVIACANLAGVLLARASARRREIAVRIAIGAGRGRLIRQLLTETMVLFAVGAAGGLLLARGLTSVVVSLLPALPIPVDVSLAIDGRVIAFATGLSFVAAVLAGLAPALQAANADVVPALKDEGQSTSGRWRARNAFVIGQVALSVVLVTGAGLFVRALQQAGSMDPGFYPQGVDIAELDLSIGGYTAATGQQFLSELLARVRARPGVEEATVAAVLPTGGAIRFGQLTHPGVHPGRGHDLLQADWNAVATGYLETLRIPLIAGRDFTAADRDGAPRVAVVSEEAARRFWPGEDAIGKTLLLHSDVRRMGEDNPPKTLLIVGVAGNVKSRLREEPRAQVYLPLLQQYVGRVTLAVRTTGSQRVAGEIPGIIASINRSLPVLTTQTLEEAAAFVLFPQRVAAAVAGTLGFVGLLLAAIGIYGVTAYAVAQRTREIGIRLALGAQRAHVVAMVFVQGMTLVVVGAAVGLVLALASGRVLAQLFFGFPPLDAIVFAATAGLALTVGLAACSGPVRRASRVDPIRSLRYE